jgi:hypothetical protein
MTELSTPSIATQVATLRRSWGAEVPLSAERPTWRTLADIIRSPVDLDPAGV